jgi:hypothetical protein
MLNLKIIKVLPGGEYLLKNVDNNKQISLQLDFYDVQPEMGDFLLMPEVMLLSADVENRYAFAKINSAIGKPPERVADGEYINLKIGKKFVGLKLIYSNISKFFHSFASKCHKKRANSVNF